MSYKIITTQKPKKLEEVLVEVAEKHQTTTTTIHNASLEGIDIQIASRKKQIAKCEEEIKKLEAERKEVEKEAKKYDFTLPQKVEAANG